MENTKIEKKRPGMAHLTKKITQGTKKNSEKEFFGSTRDPD